jgi:hypothetical protein
MNSLLSPTLSISGEAMFPKHVFYVEHLLPICRPAENPWAPLHVSLSGIRDGKVFAKKNAYF